MIAPATAEALRRAAAGGPYFAIDTDPDELLWRPFTDLLGAPVLTENVDQVRRVLQERTGTPLDELDVRACASIHALGLASRLVAPALGAAALGAHVPALAVESLHWQRVPGGPVPMALSSADGRDVNTVADAAAALHELVLTPSVAPLVEAFETTFALSPQVLWGNVASSVAGAAVMLTRCGQAARLDPLALAQAFSSSGRLARMGAWGVHGFVRRNCCLFYKIPGGGKCGDCVLIGNVTRAGDL